MPASHNPPTGRYGARSNRRSVGLIASVAAHALALAGLLLGWRSYTPPPPAAVPVVMKMIPLQSETEPEVAMPAPPSTEPVPQPEPRDAPVPPVAPLPPIPPIPPIPIVSAPAAPPVNAPLPAPDRNPTAFPPPAPVPQPQPASPPAAGLAPESWEGRVLARLIRFRRYPPAAHRARIAGVPLVRFTMDQRGRVLDSRLERTSGNALLDREAVSLPQRAQPMPAPPDDRQGRTISLVVPVEFILR